MSSLLELHEVHKNDADNKATILAKRLMENPHNSSEWHKGKMVAFDTETTGPDSNEARIVTASIVETYGTPFDPDCVVVREWLAKPTAPISENASKVHGITNQHANEHGLPADLVVREVVDIIRKNVRAGVPIVGYNLSYDFTVLDRECKRLGIEPLSEEELIIIDAHFIDYKFDKYRKGSRRLADVARVYGVSEFDAHNSSADCLASAQLVYNMAQHYYPAHLLIAPETLCSIERNWKKEWADGRNQWAVSQGREPNYNPHLGIIPED